MASTTSKTQRVVTFLLAMLFIVSTIGVVVYSVMSARQQDKTAAEQAAVQKALQEQQTKTQGDTSVAKRGLENFTPVASVPTLQTEDLVVGTGKIVAQGDTVTVDYIGVLAVNGKGFDNSYDRGQAATFPLSNVIVGWQKGLVGMKEGGTRRVYIPAAEAYGATSPSADIPANSDLVFDVKLIKIGQ